MWADVREYAKRHRFKLTGVLLGLLFAFLVIHYGVFWALFILFCAGVGYWVGKRLDDEPDSIREMLDRFLPPGSHH